MENVYSQLLTQGRVMPFAEFKQENVMEDFILGNPGVLRLDRDDSVKVVACQLDFLKGKENRKGRIDLLVSYNNETLAVVELKRGLLLVEDLNQLKSYLINKDKREKTAESVSVQTNGKITNWMGVLVGSGVDSKLFQHINTNPNLEDDLPYAIIVLKRFRSDEGAGYVSEVFMSTKTNRSKARYILNGGDPLYLKWFVLAIFTKCVEKHPDWGFSDVKSFFESHGLKLQGSDFKEFVEGMKGVENYFTGSRLLKLSDEKFYTIRCYWYKEEAESVVKAARSLGCAVDVI